MKPQVAKILLLIVVPGVAWFILYQIDPLLVDPSSEKSLFAMFTNVKKVATMAGAADDLGRSDSREQLLNIIRQAVGSEDSLLAQDEAKAGSHEATDRT